MRAAALTRAAGLVAAVCIVTASCGGSSEEAGPTPASEATATTSAPTSTTVDEVGDGGAGGGDADSAPGTSAATPAPMSGGGEPTAPPPDTAPRPEGPPPAAPVASGLYRYDTEGSSRISDGPPRSLPDVTTLEVHAADGASQRTVRDLRDRDGVGSVTEQVLRYAPDGVYLVYLELRTSVAGVSNTYEFRPATPPLVVRTGAAPGDRTTFTLEGSGTKIVTTATITGTEPVTIAGTTVSTIVLELVSELSGSLSGTQRAVSWIDPDRSLPVREDVDADVSSGAVRIRSDYTAQVQGLSPA